MCIPLHRTVYASLASYCVGRSIPMLETLDWRAVCGKTARTVRREGRARVLPYPYQREFCTFFIRIGFPMIPTEKFDEPKH